MLNNRSTINTLYTIQTVLKLLFILMSPFNLPFTLLVAFASSVIGILRVFKIFEMSKQFLQKVLMNNHGQNILYITFGMAGHVNYLYYAPIVLFFGYGIAEYIKINYPNNKYIFQVDMIRNNRAEIFKTKGILQIIFLIYLLVTIFFDFFNRIIKIFLIGQMLVMKYKINQQFRLSCAAVNKWIVDKIRGIEVLYSNYMLITNKIYGYAAQGMQ